MIIKKLLLVSALFCVSVSAMEDPNQGKKVSKEEIEQNFKVIQISKNLCLEPYIQPQGVLGIQREHFRCLEVLLSNDSNVRSTDHPDGFQKVQRAVNNGGHNYTISIGHNIKYDLNLKKEVQLGSPCWGIYENNTMVGYVQLKMNHYYQQQGHPILLIVMCQDSLQNGCDQHVCQAIIDHCFNVFGLECLEARIDSRDHKFEQVVRACKFEEKTNYNDQQGRAIKIFIKRSK